MIEIESVSFFEGKERARNFEHAKSDLIKFEVVLHAGVEDDDIVKAYISYAAQYDVSVDYKSRIQVGGLTFIVAHARPEDMKKHSIFINPRCAADAVSQVYSAEHCQKVI